MSRREVRRWIAALAVMLVAQRAESADFRRTLAELAQQQKIGISWTGGPYRYEYSWGGGTAADPSEAEVASVAQAIAREFRAYPAGFLRDSGFRGVVLVRDLRVTEDGGTRGAAGYIFEGRFFLDVPSAARAIEAGTRVRFIHHVIWHQLDERAGTMWKDPEWTALNPPGFEYGVHSRGGVHETRVGAGSLTRRFPGFLNLYSTGNLPDDKAEVFAYLMVIPGWMQQRANEDAHLRGKIGLIQARLAALDRRFDAGFWRQIRAEGDDPARYGLAAEVASGGETPLEVEHLELAVKVFPMQKRLECDAVLRLAAASRIESLELELHPEFHIAQVSVDGKRTRWKHAGGKLHLDLSGAAARRKRFAVRIAYAGFPPVARRPPWEGGMVWSKTAQGQPWIGNSHWGGGCDLLWPCIDHPTAKPRVADIRFTVPRPLVAPANGVLVEVTEQEGWRTFHWRARSPPVYGIVVNAGPFSLLEASHQSRFGNSIPMKFWYLPEYEDKARELFAEFPKILAFFESRIGPYPWADQKMGVVQSPYRGMEHQTINAYGNQFARTPYGFDELLQHEFSHEYFGNQMSVSNYDDLWLHEGFGSYMQLLYAEHLHGEADYFAMLSTTRALICNEQPLVSGKVRSQGEVYADTGGPRSDLYNKGSLVLHTLRTLIGKEAFLSSARELVYGRADPQPGNFVPQFRTTRDLVRIVNATAGEDLSWFFDAYLYERDLPNLLEVRTGRTLTLRWETERQRPFPMPLEVRVGDETIRLPMSQNRGTLVVPDGAHVIIDPQAKVLRRLDAIDRYQHWRKAQPGRQGQAARDSPDSGASFGASERESKGMEGTGECAGSISY
jgi:hypothetical protein